MLTLYVNNDKRYASQAFEKIAEEPFGDGDYSGVIPQHEGIS